MKRYIRQNTVPGNVTASDDTTIESPIRFTVNDLIDILSQIQELTDPVAFAMDEDRRLLMRVGDSMYEIGQIQTNRLPRRRVNKLEN